MTAQQLLRLWIIVISAGLAVWAISHLVTIYVEWQHRRRNAPRFEPRRVSMWVEDPTEDEPTQDLTPALLMGPCPGCRRNAGDNADCPWVGRLRLAAEQIQIPREGEPS